jgi:RNA polymerase sigma-70 factor (ECF subfamily)
MDQTKNHKKEQIPKIEPADNLTDAFNDIYKAYIRNVFRYVYNRTGNNKDAEDITSQIFLAVLEGLPKYKDNGHLAAWIFTIARRKTIDFYRKKKPLVSLDAIQFTSVNSSNEDMDRIFNHHERMQTLNKILNSLSEKEKELIRLRVVAELKFSEIANILKRSESAVKNAYYRLIERIKNRLEVTNG